MLNYKSDDVAAGVKDFTKGRGVDVWYETQREPDLVKIVDLMAERVAQQVRSQGMELQLTQEAKELLSKEGFDPQFGARPLRRAIQRMIEDPLAEEVLMGTYREGDVILAEVREGDIVFRKGVRPDSLPPVEEEPALA